MYLYGHNKLLIIIIMKHFRFSTDNSEENIEQLNVPTTEIKKEYEVLDDYTFESTISIENDPIELMSYKKTELTKKSFTCNDCGNMFVSKTYLIKHLETHNIINYNEPLQ